MERYTPEEIMAQVVAVHTYKTEQHRSNRWIAEKMGISTATVSERWNRAQTSESFAQGYDTAAERRSAAACVDRWLERVEENYREGILGVTEAVKSVVPLLARKCRLLGLDMPQKVSIVPDGPVIDPDVVAAVQASIAEAERVDAARG